MNLDAQALLDVCHFPQAGAFVDLAVSGGPDSLGLLLLALEAGLVVTVHHVDHHARPSSGDDAAHVRAVCGELEVEFLGHDVSFESGGNFEARARSARRRVLPPTVMTGHTMDDLAETVMLNMLRGAGLDGLSPMINHPSKPLRDVRRRALHDFVEGSGQRPLYDETNDSADFRRNRVRHELLPMMCDVANRDVVPLLARQASLMYDERMWLNELSQSDTATSLETADCRELRTWPAARLRRWLRHHLRRVDQGEDTHPPSSAEVSRAFAVVRGEIIATELDGGRRLARRGQHLTLEEGSQLR